jgi:acetylornithine deacetylase/succinyl-diaminopimelate desuccinylase-like protein
MPPGERRVACSVVRLGGGEGLNSIPREAWVEIDLRSESPEAIAATESVLSARADEALARENARRTPGSPALTLARVVIGDRPSGTTPATHPLVQAGVDATRAIGRQPALVVASTDANVPIALGIPAIAIGAGGRSGDAHLPTEWYDNTDGPLGLFRVALVLAAAAGVR